MALRAHATTGDRRPARAQRAAPAAARRSLRRRDRHAGSREIRRRHAGHRRAAARGLRRGVESRAPQRAVHHAAGVAAAARAWFRLPTCAAAESRIDDFFVGVGLKPRHRLVVLNPGAGRGSKRWPVERFRALAERLCHEGDAEVLAIWGQREHEAARAIVEMPAPRPALAPPTDLDELAAVARRATVMVAGDTGPLHLAAAVGTPCVGLYGPTSAARNGPYGTGHRVIAAPDGKMASIDVPAVLDAVLAVIGR